MNVLIVSKSFAYEKLFTKLGFKLVESINSANLVCFTGGEDVYPAMYGQATHPETHYNKDRDASEKLIYAQAVEAKIPMVGICRGAQFLHVMNGGSLFQHADNHARFRAHNLLDLVTKEEVDVTSTHHQMMMEDVGKVIGVAHESNNKEYIRGCEIVKHSVSDYDVEVVWHEHTKCLCFQPHPEFHSSADGADSTFNYFKRLLARYIIGEINNG